MNCKSFKKEEKDTNERLGDDAEPTGNLNLKNSWNGH